MIIYPTDAVALAKGQRWRRGPRRSTKQELQAVHAVGGVLVVDATMASSYGVEGLGGSTIYNEYAGDAVVVNEPFPSVSREEPDLSAHEGPGDREGELGEGGDNEPAEGRGRSVAYPPDIAIGVGQDPPRNTRGSGTPRDGRGTRRGGRGTPRGGRGYSYTEAEDECLISAYVNVTEDSIQGTNQRAEDFWNSVQAKMLELMARKNVASPSPVARTPIALKNRVKTIERECKRYMFCNMQARKTARSSGWSELDFVDRAEKLYFEERRAKIGKDADSLSAKEAAALNFKFAHVIDIIQEMESLSRVAESAVLAEPRHVSTGSNDDSNDDSDFDDEADSSSISHATSTPSSASRSSRSYESCSISGSESASDYLQRRARSQASKRAIGNKQAKARAKQAKKARIEKDMRAARAVELAESEERLNGLMTALLVKQTSFASSLAVLRDQFNMVTAMYSRGAITDEAYRAAFDARAEHGPPKGVCA